MPTAKQNLNFVPWVSGIAQAGKALKLGSALDESEDMVYGFDGTKMRRGGQVHAHRIPFREGLVIAEHFLDEELIERNWTGNPTDIPNTYSFVSPSVIRGDFSSAGTGGSIQKLMTDGAGDELVKFLVLTLNADPAIAETQTTLISVQARMKFNELPAWGGLGGSFEGFHIIVDPGKPGDGATDEWHLDMGWASNGIQILNESGAYAEISGIGGVVNHLSAADSSDYIDAEWHTWRVDITRLADTAGPVRHYIASLYLDEVLIFSNIEMENLTIVPTATILTWFPDIGVTGIDVEVDNIDTPATIRTLNDINRFEIPQESIVTKFERASIAVGSRVVQSTCNA
jgi:hypothetical protein